MPTPNKPRTHLETDAVHIFDPAQSAAILHSIHDIEAGNNGWAFVPPHAWLHSALVTAGYVVITSTDVHGRPAFKGYTKHAQQALKGQPFAQSTYKPVRIDRQPAPDYEGAILDRQERDSAYW